LVKAGVTLRLLLKLEFKEVKNMDKKELATWMERRGVGLTLRAWVNNELLGRRNYSDLEGLVTDGTATIKISLAKTGKLSITPSEITQLEISNREMLVSNLERENAILKKTVKTKEKEIASLEKASAKKKKVVKKVTPKAAAEEEGVTSTPYKPKIAEEADF